jgi:hypothetical protein
MSVHQSSRRFWRATNYYPYLAPNTVHQYSEGMNTTETNFQAAHAFCTGYAAADLAIATQRKPDLLIADLSTDDGVVQPDALRGAISCLLKRANDAKR